jgi:hypothetical protein
MSAVASLRLVRPSRRRRAVAPERRRLAPPVIEVALLAFVTIRSASATALIIGFRALAIVKNT